MFNVNFDQIGFTTFLVVYVSGMITSLTPCVYPIIPIVVGFLGSREGGIKSRFKASLAYVLGLSLVYALLGVIAALTGSMFGDMTANPYLYLVFGVMLLALGGNMMDWYYVPMPNFIKKGTNAPFLMGVTSGLVASPCTAPVLAGLLLYVASKKAVISGGLLMFTFAIGMNTILLAIGFSASLATKLPKSGKWMVIVKKVLALMIISSGIYFIFKAGTLY